jgi:regulator of replication initiation timing
MDCTSELNDLQIKNAELMAQNLILTKHIAQLRDENLRLTNENEHLMAELMTQEMSDESEEEESDTESESKSTE